MWCVEGWRRGMWQCGEGRWEKGGGVDLVWRYRREEESERSVGNRD